MNVPGAPVPNGPGPVTSLPSDFVSQPVFFTFL
jgi:hypothetical protein